jgi:hypothetical protein
MKLPPAPSIAAFLFLCLALKGVAWLGREEPSSAGETIWGMVVVAITFAVAYALWKRRPDAVHVYWLWATAVVGGRCVMEHARHGEPLLAVAIVGIAMAALYVAIGLYLKSMLRRHGAAQAIAAAT